MLLDANLNAVPMALNIQWVDAHSGRTGGFSSRSDQDLSARITGGQKAVDEASLIWFLQAVHVAAPSCRMHG